MIAPLETLYDNPRGIVIPLPSTLEAFYGRLQLDAHTDRPFVFGNFVSSLDGVTSFEVPGQEGGGPISGYNAQDQALMGLLRALADVVIVGAGTQRVSPGHIWTPAHISPSFADAFQQLRANLRKTPVPLNVVVTSQGVFDPAEPLFHNPDLPVLVITTSTALARIHTYHLSPSVQVIAAQPTGFLTARGILETIARVYDKPPALVLLEGGPRLMGTFFADHLLDELFLTLAPQIAGRDEEHARPGLVAGTRFLPEQALWGTLLSVKRSENHLFLRYSFAV